MVMWNEKPIPSSASSIRTLVHSAFDTARSLLLRSLKSLTIMNLLRCVFFIRGGRADRVLEHIEPFIEHGVGHGQGAQEFHHFVIGTGGFDDQPALERFRADLLGHVSRAYIDPLHHAAPAHFSPRHLLGDLRQAIVQMCALAADLGGKAVILPELLKRDTRGHKGMGVARKVPLCSAGFQMSCSGLMSSAAKGSPKPDSDFACVIMSGSIPACSNEK